MKPQKTKLSIVIPAWNAEQTLTRTVESILAQTFQSWELIIVNDGSTDKTENICLDLAAKHDRIKLINTPNQGAYKARIVGATQASADWITFIDSDDILEEKDLATLIDIINDSGNCDIIVGTIRFDGNTHRKGSRFVHQITGKIDAEAYQNALLSGKTSIGPVAKAYKKLMFLNALPSLQTYRFNQNEDLLMLLKLAKECHYGIYIDPLQRPVYTYFRRKGSASSTLIPPITCKKLFDVIEASLLSTDLVESLQKYKLNILFGQCIVNGQNLSSFEDQDILSPIFKGLEHCDLSPKENILVALFRHPKLTKIMHRIFRLAVKGYRLVHK